MAECPPAWKQWGKERWIPRQAPGPEGLNLGPSPTTSNSRTLNLSFSLSLPHFPHMKIGMKTVPNSESCCEAQWLHLCKALQKCWYEQVIDKCYPLILSILLLHFLLYCRSVSKTCPWSRPKSVLPWPWTYLMLAPARPMFMFFLLKPPAVHFVLLKFHKFFFHSTNVY